MALLSASRYLTEVKAALTYTRSKMDLGETNKFGKNVLDLPRGKIFTTLPAIQEVYRQEEKLLNAMRVPMPNDANWGTYGLQYIEAMAMASSGIGAGNCEEQAAIAFMYLYKHDIRPIDYMMIPGTHAFVVVGAAVRPTSHNFNDWSTGVAMLCDPWGWRAEPACNICIRYSPTKMGSSFRVE
ncbi:MAG: hypothetical protein HY808_12415 [Nitrospirae bacterium]|nr:hypothetical protein [Nitrospirota bacterium]